MLKMCFVQEKSVSLGGLDSSSSSLPPNYSFFLITHFSKHLSFFISEASLTAFKGQQNV